MSLYEHFAYNILFNLGYIIKDVEWLIELDTLTGNEVYTHFRRIGFVIGDIYVRFFFRTMNDVSVK